MYFPFAMVYFQDNLYRKSRWYLSAAVQFPTYFYSDFHSWQTDCQGTKTYIRYPRNGIFFPPFLSTAIKKIVGDAVLLLNKGSEIARQFFLFRPRCNCCTFWFRIWDKKYKGREIAPSNVIDAISRILSSLCINLSPPGLNLNRFILKWRRKGAQWHWCQINGL